jgi:ribosomal protein L37AE/L43A
MVRCPPGRPRRRGDWYAIPDNMSYESGGFRPAAALGRAAAMGIAPGIGLLIRSVRGEAVAGRRPRVLRCNPNTFRTSTPAGAAVPASMMRRPIASARADDEPHSYATTVPSPTAVRAAVIYLAVTGVRFPSAPVLGEQVALKAEGWELLGFGMAGPVSGSRPIRVLKLIRGDAESDHRCTKCREYLHSALWSCVPSSCRLCGKDARGVAVNGVAALAVCDSPRVPASR